MNSIVFSPSNYWESKPRFARFCQNERDVRDAIAEIGPAISMVIPLGDPAEVAELLEIGFIERLRRLQAGETHDSRRAAMVKSIGEGLRKADMRPMTEQEKREAGL